MPAIGSSLEAQIAELQWIVSAYTIAFAAFILTAGALGDRLGAKKVFMAGFAIFTLASLACALAPTAESLIGARAIQGFGAAILVPNSLALLNHAFRDEKERGRAVGYWAAGASLALTAGPFAGGALLRLPGGAAFSSSICPSGWRVFGSPQDTLEKRQGARPRPRPYGPSAGDRCSGQSCLCDHRSWQSRHCNLVC